MSAENERLYAEKVKRIQTMMNHQEPDHVPVMASLETFAISNANTTSRAILNNAEKEYEVFGKIFKDIYFDCTMMWFLTRDVFMYEPLGSAPYSYAGDDIAIQHMEHCYMTPEDYPAFIENPMMFTVNEYYKRKYPVFNEPYPQSYEKLAKSFRSFLTFIQKAGGANDYYRKNVGIAPIMSGIHVMPFDQLLDSYRGFAGMLSDVRRRPEQVKEACEAMVPIVLNEIFQGKDTLDDYPYIFFPNDGATYLSPKQFEKVYWPSFSKILNKIYESGGKVFMTLPGTWKHLWPFIKSLPKNFCLCLIDSNDDIFEAKKELGDTVAITGGLTPEILRSTDLKMVEAYCKKLVDECAPGGGFMATESRLLLSPNDANYDTLKFANQLIHDYGTRK